MQHVPDQGASADIILVLQLIGMNDALLLLPLLLVRSIRPAGMPPPGSKDSSVPGHATGLLLAHEPLQPALIMVLDVSIECLSECPHKLTG